jgi:hypothetical protein
VSEEVCVCVCDRLRNIDTYGGRVATIAFRGAVRGATEYENEEESVEKQHTGCAHRRTARTHTHTHMHVRAPAPAHVAYLTRTHVRRVYAHSCGRAILNPTSAFARACVCVCVNFRVSGHYPRATCECVRASVYPLWLSA